MLEVWTGPQVDFLLARKQEHKIGGALNKAWIWIPLCVLFVAPFFDPRRPLRLLHLDLLVLLAFGVAQLLFNDGELERLGAGRLPGAAATCWCACCWPDSGRASAASR